ncbi:TIGR00730 family Rossman fold protein [Dermacoccaceae bacterium W4C1]
MTRVALFTGSSHGNDPRWEQAAVQVTRHLVRRGVGIVYGGGSVGLMGAVADVAMEEGAEVIGVIPRGLFAKEVAHHGLTQLVEVDSMHERKSVMAAHADAFIALPGGIGTLEEIFEAWTCNQLGIHAKPVAFYDVHGYWSPMMAAIDSMVEAGFITRAVRENLVVESTPDLLWEGLRRRGLPDPEQASD